MDKKYPSASPDRAFDKRPYDLYFFRYNPFSAIVKACLRLLQVFDMHEQTEINVLLIEDDEREHAVIRNCLSGAFHSNFKLNRTADFDAGLQALSKGKHDVCLFDYRLGERDGLKLILSAARRRDETPIIILLERHDAALRALKEGASDCLLKGEIGPSLLERSILYAIERRKRQDLLEEMGKKGTAESAKAQEDGGEEALLECEAFQNMLLETIPIPVFYKDKAGRYLGVNKAFETFVGISRAQLVGKSVFDVNPPHLAETYRDQDLELFEKGGVQVYDSQVLDARGVLHDVIFQKASIVDSKGEVTGLIGAVLDVTEQKRTERALRESEERFRSLIHAVPHMVWVARPDGFSDFYSQRTLDFLGKTQEQMKGWTWVESVYEEDRARAVAAWKQAVHTGEEYRIEFRIRSKTGDFRWFLTHAVPQRDERGRILRWYGASTDIHDIKLAEEALEQSEERARSAAAEANEKRSQLQVLIDSAPLEVSLFDGAGGVLYTNPAGLRLHGFSALDDFLMNFDRLAEALEARTPEGELIPVSEWPLVRALKGETVRDLELELHNRVTGRTWMGLLYAAPVFDEKGEVASVVIFNQDITRIKEAEAGLREAHASSERHLAQLNALVNQMTEGLIIFDPEGNLLDMNPAALAIHGFDNASSLRKHLDRLAEVFELFDLKGRLLPPEEWPIGRVLGGETFDSYEVRARRRDNGKSWIGSYGGAPVHDRDGKVILCIVTLRDVSEQKRLEEALKESEGLFREAFELAPVGMVLTDPNDGRLERVNPAYCRITGYSQEELLKPDFNFKRLTHPEDLGQNVLEVDRVMAGVIPSFCMEKRYFRKDGSVVWVQVSATVRRDDEGRPYQIVGLVEDIEARKHAQEELRKARDELEQRVKERTAELESAKLNLEESERRFREVLETSLDAVYRRNLKTDVYDYMSPGIEEISGYAPEEMLSMPAAEVFSLIHPSESERIEEELLEAQRKGNKKYLLEYRFNRKDGGYRWFSELISIVNDSEGKPLYRVGSIRDVTEQKSAEEALRAYAARLEALNSELEDFAFIAAHDLQEPLRKIQVFSDRIIGRYDSSLEGRARDDLKRLASSAGRMQELVEDIRAYSKVTSSQPFFEKVELKKLVEEAVSDLELRVEETGASIEIGKLHPVESDPHLMRILFQNLLSNALKYRSEKAPVIRICSMELEKDIQVAVEDNGIGFEEKYADLIFKPFKRLHGRHEYEGTGMGLAICRKIAERHGGRIRVESAPGKGTTFKVTLPRERKKQALLREGAEGPVPERSAMKGAGEGSQWLNLELSVHRIDLEMQIEELRRTQVELESLRDQYYDLYDMAPVGYVILKPTGIIKDVNHTGVQMLGLKSRHLSVGIPLSRFVAPDCQERYYRHINALKKTGKGQRRVLDLVGADGKTFRCLLASAPQIDEKGTISLIRIAITDMSPDRLGRLQEDR